MKYEIKYIVDKEHYSLVQTTNDVSISFNTGKSGGDIFCQCIAPNAFIGEQKIGLNNIKNFEYFSYIWDDEPPTQTMVTYQTFDKRAILDFINDKFKKQDLLKIYRLVFQLI